MVRIPESAPQHRLARLVRPLVLLGVTDEMPLTEARYVILTNIVSLLGVLFTLAFAPFTLLMPSFAFVWMQLLIPLVYLPPLLFNRRRRYFAAITALLLATQLVTVGQVLIEGYELGVQGFYLMQAILPFLLYPPRHARAMIAMSAFGSLGFLLLHLFGPELPRLGPPIPSELYRLLRPTMLAGLYLSIAACAYYARLSTLIAEQETLRERQRSEDLLLNILPAPIAERLKAEHRTIADGFTEVTVLFADIVGFTKLSQRLPPERVVELLNELFSAFDDLAGRLGLEKIKTIGDAYMVAGGLPAPRADHAEAVAEMALAMIEVVRRFGEREGETLGVRVGINSGPAVAGVIGKKKFIYDLWGDTVNTASRMESHGTPGAIQVSESTYALLAARYVLRERGEIEVKGKGQMRTWYLEGRKTEVAAKEAAATKAAG